MYCTLPVKTQFKDNDTNKLKVRDKLKLQDITMHLLEWLKLNTLTISSTGKDVEQLQLIDSTILQSHQQPLWITGWQFLRKLNIHLLYDSVIPVLAIYPREMKICPSEDLLTNIHSSMIHSS